MELHETLLFGGLAGLPWWGCVLVALALTHITIAAVNIYLHSNQAHRSVELHPLVSHFFRFWLWLTTGMVTKEWAAIHRKHHAKVESEDDPHSPQVHGILKVLFGGAFLYNDEAHNRETIEKYGYGCPDDWIERKIYTPWHWVGIIVMLAINVVTFGFLTGAAIWVVQMIWIPFWAAGVINGVGHYLGYRNFQTTDESRNIVPLGVVIGGEELHNNHHAYPTSSKLSSRWYEIDLGWTYISILQTLRLAKVKRVAPQLLGGGNPICDLDTLNAVIANRFEVVARFSDKVRSTFSKEAAKLSGKLGVAVPKSPAIKKWLSFRESRIGTEQREALRMIIDDSETLRRLEKFRHDLAQLWEDREASTEQLIERLREWCHAAEESGINALREFAIELRGFSSVSGIRNAA
ncbi:MAG: fatty acid desaturase [Betaproteobacteria bacterium]|nr:fatty acid desaturase [Betaproteobacteria bacterium]